MDAPSLLFRVSDLYPEGCCIRRSRPCAGMCRFLQKPYQKLLGILPNIYGMFLK